MANEYSLWLDDERPMPKDYHIHFKTAWDIIAFMEMKFATSGVLPQRVSLDHDLGDPLNGTGYDVACWLEEQYYSGRFKDPIILLCHSDNGAVLDKMRVTLERCTPKHT